VQKNWGYFFMLQFFFFDFLSMKIIIKKVFSSSWFFFINTSFLINFLGKNCPEYQGNFPMSWNLKHQETYSGLLIGLF